MTTTENTPLSNLEFENPAIFHQLDDRHQEVIIDLDGVLEVTDMLPGQIINEIEESGVLPTLEDEDEIGLVNHINDLIW